MNQDRVLKVIKGLNSFSPDDIEIMTGFCGAETENIIGKFLSDGIIARFSESEYRYINKIPEHRGILRLVEKPQVKPIPDKNISFQQAAEYFLMNYALQNCTPSTFKTYRSSIRTHLIPFFAKMNIRNITQQDIKNFIELKFQENLSNKNIRNCITLFGTMFNRFIEWGMLESSPYNGILNVKTQKQDKLRILNEEEISLLLKKSKNKSLISHKFILLILFTGLKRSEIFALTKKDIDFKNKKINVNKTLYMGKVIFSKVKTVIRHVDLPENIIRQLKIAVKNKQEADFIFYDKAMSYYTQDKRLRGTFASIVKQLKLDKFTFDELRYTYAYNALKQGISIDYLHKQLGEYSIQATMDKYRDYII